jgi:uncharacterized Zn-finger protein
MTNFHRDIVGSPSRVSVARRSVPAVFVADYRPEPRERKYKCNIQGCGKEFDRNSNLNAHLKTHGDRTLLVCEMEGCERTFNRRADMSRHIRTVHYPQRHLLCPD